MGLSPQQALQLRETNGFSVIPITPNDKKPLASWKKYQTDFATDEELYTWFDGANSNRNIGVVTGNISQITVVDIDHKDPKKKTPLSKFPKTYTVQTPSGGYHLYYKYTPDIQTNANQYIHLPYVDIRNDGGFVVAPPSVVKGSEYKVIDDSPLADFPHSVFNNGKNTRFPTTEKKTLSLKELGEGFKSMADGAGRNNALTQVAGKLIGRTPEDDWSLVKDQMYFFNDKFADPLDRAEVDTIFNSIAKKQKASGTVSPIAAAEVVGARLRTTRSNIPHKDMTNVFIILKSHPEYKDSIKYNLFRKEIEYKGEPIEDSDILQITLKIQDELLPNISDSVVFKAVQHFAHENSYDEVLDWLASLEWDGKERLATWLPRATGAPDDDYHNAIGAQWFIGMVRRITHPGCTFDHVLTAIGGQGVGKTSLFRIIGGEWYKTFTGTVDNKDFYLALRGAILVDLDEGSTMYKSDSIKIKSIITETVDEYRAPYGRVTERHPRRFVFSMSTNDTEPFRDQTGNRRYLPFNIPKKVDFKWMEDNRDQIFAEAYDIVKKKRYNEVQEIPFLTALKKQEERIAQDSWVEPIQNYLARSNDYCVGSEEYSTTEEELFMNVINPDKDRQSLMGLNKQNEMRIGQILRNQLGFEKRRVQMDGQQKNRYFMTQERCDELQENNATPNKTNF